MNREYELNAWAYGLKPGDLVEVVSQIAYTRHNNTPASIIEYGDVLLILARPRAVVDFQYQILSRFGTNVLHIQAMKVYCRKISA